MCFVSGQSFRLRRLRTMRQTVGSSMFSQVRLACEQALHLGYSREFTWQPYTKGDASTRGGKRSPFPHPSWLRRSLARSLASPTKIGEQWKYFTNQRSQRPYNTLRNLLLFLFHHSKRAREEIATRAPFESHGVSRLFLSQLAYYARHSCVLG